MPLSFFVQMRFSFSAFFLGPSFSRPPRPFCSPVLLRDIVGPEQPFCGLESCSDLLFLRFSPSLSQFTQAVPPFLVVTGAMQPPPQSRDGLIFAACFSPMSFFLLETIF